MRANLLDELHKPYVTTARAKGLSEFRLLIKYPVRLALNPFVSTHRLGLPAAHQRRGHHRVRAVAADLGAAAAAGAAGAGHVSGRRVHPAALLRCRSSACWSPTSCSAILDPRDQVPVTAMTAAVLDPRMHRKQAERASQWRLMWMAFRRHRLAMIGRRRRASCSISWRSSPSSSRRSTPTQPDARDVYHPPQAIQLIDTQPTAAGPSGPTSIGMKQARDPLHAADHLRRPIRTSKIYLDVLRRGRALRALGRCSRWSAICSPPLTPDERFYLFGADRLGRDMLSRVISGTRDLDVDRPRRRRRSASSSGLLLGGISGYFGGVIDTVIQRVVELMMSLPTIPIWLGLSAALPQDWSPLTRYFAITLILSLVGWTELARVVRGRFLALRTRGFRHRGAARRRQRGAHHLPPHAAVDG